MPLYLEETAQFARIAREAFHATLELRRRVPDPPSRPNAGEEFAEFQARVQGHLRFQEEADRYSYVVIVFAACALEAFINSLAARKLTSQYFERHLDKLDLLSKWVVIPRLIAGYELDRGGKAFELLQALVRSRNRLAHPKVHEVKSLDETPDLGGKLRDPQADAATAITALDEMAQIVTKAFGLAEAEVLLGSSGVH